MRAKVCEALRMFDDALRANRRYAEHFRMGTMPAPTTRGFALLTCMDTRIDPLAILGLHPGEAKIIRNAGGRATDDALRSLVLATHFLAVTEIAVMHHTRCALAGQSEDGVRSALADAGTTPGEAWSSLAMPDPDAALRADVQAVRSCAMLPPGTKVEGWRYDVGTGLVSRILAA